MDLHKVSTDNGMGSGAQWTRRVSGREGQGPSPSWARRDLCDPAKVTSLVPPISHLHDEIEAELSPGINGPA